MTLKIYGIMNDYTPHSCHPHSVAVFHAYTSRSNWALECGRWNSIWTLFGLTYPILLPQQSVEAWLVGLELEEYTELFHAEGYKTEEDVENLKDLTSKELKAMGINKRGTASHWKLTIASSLWQSHIAWRLRVKVPLKDKDLFLVP